MANELRRLNADSIGAVRGGSAVVSARAAAIYLAEGDDLAMKSTRRNADGRMHSPRLNALKIPQLIVPTTPNTAMAKVGTAIFDSDQEQRRTLFDPKTRAQAIFLHADLLTSSPTSLVVSASAGRFVAGDRGAAVASGRRDVRCLAVACDAPAGV